MKYYKKNGNSLHEVSNIASKNGLLTDEQLAKLGYLPFETKEAAMAHYEIVPEEKPEKPRRIRLA